MKDKIIYLCGAVICVATCVLSLTAYTFVLLILPIWLASAYAQDVEQNWPYRQFRRCEHRGWDGQCAWYSYRYFQVPPPHRYRSGSHAYYLPEAPPTRVYSYERRGDVEYGGGVECRSPISVTGDDKLDQDKAEISAQERWSLRVEQRVGGIFSDIRYAARIRTACVRKVPGSLTERGQATLGVRHWVCDVEASPCRAPAVRQDDSTRAKRRSETIDDERAAPAPTRRDR